jgi:hypothetical protein
MRFRLGTSFPEADAMPLDHSTTRASSLANEGINVSRILQIVTIVFTFLTRNAKLKN